MRTIIGIDVSKNKANVAVATDLRVISEFKISTDILGFTKLSQTISSCNSAPEIVFEATGVYSRRLENYLRQQHLNYHILNPLTAKNRISTGSRLRKNDRRDARRLAITEFTEETTPNLLAYQQDPVYRELMDMNRYYDQLNEDKKRARNRAHRVLQLTFASFTDSKDGFDLDNQAPWKLLTLFPHAQCVREIEDLNDLEAKILAGHFKGIGPKTSHKYARQLWKVAAKNGDAVSVTSDNVRQFQEFSILKSIPEIGTSSAAHCA